jgi:hypothetical protein
VQLAQGQQQQWSSLWGVAVAAAVGWQDVHGRVPESKQAANFQRRQQQLSTATSAQNTATVIRL